MATQKIRAFAFYAYNKDYIWYIDGLIGQMCNILAVYSFFLENLFSDIIIFLYGGEPIIDN